MPRLTKFPLGKMDREVRKWITVHLSQSDCTLETFLAEMAPEVLKAHKWNTDVARVRKEANSLGFKLMKKEGADDWDRLTLAISLCDVISDVFTDELARQLDCPD